MGDPYYEDLMYELDRERKIRIREGKAIPEDLEVEAREGGEGCEKLDSILYMGALLFVLVIFLGSQGK